MIDVDALARAVRTVLADDQEIFLAVAYGSKGDLFAAALARAYADEIEQLQRELEEALRPRGPVVNGEQFAFGYTEEAARYEQSTRRVPSGCTCVPPRRNDVAFHTPTCPWRIAILAERR